MKENAFFQLFKKAFPKGTDFKNSKIYHIKSFQDTDSNMQLFDQHKFEKDFYKILDSLSYNTQTNNVGIYYVINSEGKGLVYKISDPIEFLENEYIMEKYEWILDENVMSLKTVVQIN